MHDKVICLGKTFSSDEERREYFRNELRKRIPELKKIEGFPTGDDEDIIELSDPPFYTACPNPWINDFIVEWELEKEKVHGYKNDIKIKEPYASDISEGKNNPIYYAHSYHTKVPHPAIMRYILHYTRPGDIVFDGFAGTGMTGVAVQFCSNPDVETKYKIEKEWKEMFGKVPEWGKRRAICGDLSPVASYIAYNYNAPLDFSEIEEKALCIIKKLEDEWSWIYETKHNDKAIGKINYVIWSDIFICHNCAHEIVFWDAAVDDDRNNVSTEFYCPKCHKVNSKSSAEKLYYSVFDKALGKMVRLVKRKPVLINYIYNGKRYEKIPDKDDIKRIEAVDPYKENIWFPIDELPDGFNTKQPKESHGLNYVHQFYTNRSLLILSKLWEMFNNYQRLILTSVLVKTASLLHNIGLKDGKINLAGALPNVLYIPSNLAERNIFELVKEKFKDFRFERCKDYSIVQTGSSTDIPIKDSSIDYIFVDPPFGANIMYSELNYIWESWLKVKTNNLQEAIENKVHKKSLLDYQELITVCFKEYFRILKPGKWITIEFSNTSAAVWNGIQTSLQRAGFIIANVAALDKKQGSFKAQTTLTAVKQDLIITCYKPDDDFDRKVINQTSEIGLWDFISEHMSHLPVHIIQGDKSTAIIERNPKILYDRLVTYFVLHGFSVPIDAVDFQIGLKQRYVERDGMYFTMAQSVEYDNEKSKYGSNKQLTLFEIIYTEDDAIQYLKERLRIKSQTYRDIMPEFRKANVATRKGEIEIELKTILEENFIQENDGTWRIPDIKEAKDREALRNKSLLKEFNKYITDLTSTKVKKLKAVRAEALRAGFKHCWEKKDFQTIVSLAEKIPQNILFEDEQLLIFYDIARDRI